ncbi:MAG: CoA transferase, partial [Chloroflexi bacterium]|nr:CoA transferase [Chloroflexota bacterium]
RYSMSYPQLGGDWYEQAGAWQATNLNKRNLTLDLNSSEGKRIFARMVASADVVVENYSPRVIDNFGFGVDRLRELNPRLIIVRMPGFGLEGPWKDYVGWAMSIEQGCGAAWVTGDPNGVPLNPGGFADPVIGMHALVAVQAALEHRDLTAEAQVIEVAQLETAACWTAEQVIAYSLAGKVQQRIGNRSETMAPQGVHKCAGNQWIALSVRSDDEWGKLTALMGSPNQASDSRFSSVKARMENHAETDRMISAWSASQKADAIVAQLRAAGIPVSKVFTAVDMISDPHLSARKFYQPLEHRTMGVRRYTRWPMVQNPGPMGTHRYGVATMGQHNAEILGKELGLSAAEIDDLAKKQVIGTVPKGLQ